MNSILAFIWSIVWPVIKNDIIAFIKRYQEDAEFKRGIDAAVRLVEDSHTPEGKANASKALQQAMSRR